MHSDQLKEILSSHKLWRESKGTQGKRADLRGANLYGANLQEAYLREAKFTIEIREVFSMDEGFEG